MLEGNYLLASAGCLDLFRLYIIFFNLKILKAMHSHNSNNVRMYTIKGSSYPIFISHFHQRFLFILLQFLCLYMKIKIYCMFLSFYTKGYIICTLFCNLLFSCNNDGNFFILVHRRFLHSTHSCKGFH